MADPIMKASNMRAAVKNPMRATAAKSIDHELLQLDIEDCVRCGYDHQGVVFMTFLQPPPEWQWWGTCPNSGDPILMTTTEIPNGSS